MRKGNLVKKFGLFLLLILILVSCSNEKESDNNEDKKEVEREKHEEIFNPEPNPNATQISSYNSERIGEQGKKEEEINAEYEKGTYTFDEPFIKVNPYNLSPLTALLKFETKKPAEIEVLVGTGENEVTIEKKWEGYETTHEIPVLGLYPATDNKVILKAHDEEGQTETVEITLTTDELPEELPITELDEADPEQMEEGLTFIVPSKNYLYAVDENADVRWYTDMESRLILTRVNNGNLLVNTKDSEEEKFDELLEMDMTGKVINAYEIDIDSYEDDNLIHHDVIELPSGNLLVTTHDPEGKYVEDHMHEINRETGETVQEIDLKDVFPAEVYEEYNGEYADKNDWFHQNAIWFDETDNTIVISGRHQDAVMKLSYPDAEIEWILAADEDWQNEYSKYLLQPDGDVKFPAAQHAMKILPDMDGDENTVDLLLFDNNHVVTRGDRDISNQYSRAVQYRINEKEKTVSEVWSYGEERGEAFYSEIIGNAQYLPNTGNRLITSGYIDPEEDSDKRISKIVETNDKDDADVIFEITLPNLDKYSGKYVYRAVRMPLYYEMPIYTNQN